MIASLLFLSAVSAVTPVQQVINMMQDMVTHGKTEKHEEQVAFSAEAQFCDDTADRKQKDIADSADRIEQLEADILKAQADQAKLSDEIKVLDSNAAAWASDKAKAIEMRNKEKADYDELHRDYSASIDSIMRAISTLESNKPSSSLLQEVTTHTRVPTSVKRAVTAFISESATDPLDVTAPQASAYEFQGGGVVEMLEKLEDKFKKELEGYEKEEMEEKHAHNMAVTELTNAIKEAERQSGEKSASRAARVEAEATAKGDLSTTKSDKAADEKYSADLDTECTQKSRDFESRQMLRKGELEALGEAIGIMAGGAVSGNADKHLPALIQESMALLRSKVSQSPKVRKVTEYLQMQASAKKSKLLTLMASKAAESPFDSVKKMIKNMIVKLMEEANEESEHKGWCDTEMTTNKQTRDDKADAVATLTANADELDARITALGHEVAELSSSIAAINEAVEQATALRQQETSTNTVTIAEAQQAQEAVAKATNVLKEFYAGAATATAFVQGFQGQQGESTGVLGMMEVISTDFARLEADTTTAESEGATQFQKFTDDSELDRSVKQMDVDNKQKDKTSAESDLNDTKKDLTATQVELDAALSYFDKLKPSCVDAGLSYEDRVRQRQEEIESLQQAEKILSGEDIA